ncbi:hypothetical protein C2E21_1940 [Chlorella sorokiniana]|uniref:Uncharacterized protein n=1 Tax=Chlorella sorokiniana TaxID=3076 RepID=A0A2P6U1B7_CHLSO|nr:hypothetical protein C2E21_1940 [Chlorella sorokiniana]|eukprot:PRW60111.1 hypothetical protein C2E21_1940 [Chlorella sorokiniana]
MQEYVHKSQAVLEYLRTPLPGGWQEWLEARYSAALQEHLKQCLEKSQQLAYGSGDAATVHFRIAAAQLPTDACAAWVQHKWVVAPADLAAVASKASHLFKKKK